MNNTHHPLSKYEECVKLIGEISGRLSVIGVDRHDTENRVVLVVKCECGVIKKVNRNKFVNGKVISCGCYQLEYNSNLKDWRTRLPEYGTWCGMLQRCCNKKNNSYKNYGGRGIAICDAWLNDFAIFLRDMGKKPKGHTIERIDVNGNYEPSNCRWATTADQSFNRRNTKYLLLRGETMNRPAFIEKTKMSLSEYKYYIYELKLTGDEAYDRYIQKSPAHRFTFNT